MDYKYHYHPKKNWINDPNGLCYFNGLFHIYYQYNPCGNAWGNICWGHATTIDFINYKEEQIALKNDLEYDKDGCFSGNSIVINDTLYIYYTSVKDGKQTQSVAYSKDGFNFIKYENNPIIDTTFEARDPFVFKYNDKLYMLLGSEKGILLYEGSTPFNFKFKSILIDLKEFGECPNLIKLNDKYLLKYSSMIDRLDHFLIGDFNGVTFTKEKEVKINLPKNYYASQIFKYKNDFIMIGWIFNDNYKTDKPYNGVLSIPRIIEYNNGILTTKPYFCNETKIIDIDITEEF